MRKIISEFLGMLLLTMSVVGSGIMASNLTSDKTLTLLSNSYSTAAMLVIIIVP